MNRRRLLLMGFALLLAIAPAQAQVPDASKVTAVWNLTEGFQLPKGACYDPKTKKVFVSNMGTAPDAKDGSGYLTIVTLDGKVDTAKWVTGLNAPRGMRTFEDTLWVAAVDELIGIDIPTGKVAKRMRPEGARFLCDVAIAKDGTVYVSDLIQNRILSYDGRDLRVFIEGEEAEWPNGIVIDGDRLVVAGWGKPEPDLTTKIPGRLVSFELATKKKSFITEKPTGNLGGVEPDKLGAYIVTDSIAGTVMRVGSNGSVHPLLQGLKKPADFAYLPEKTLLIVPRIDENAVTAYDLGKLK